MGKDKIFVGMLLLVFGLLLAFAFLSINGRSTDHFSQAFLESHSGKAENNGVFFSFRLENHEGQDMEYVYSVFFDGGKMYGGAISIQDGSSKTVSGSLNVPAGFSGKKKVLVEISSPAKPVSLSLFFWVYS